MFRDKLKLLKLIRFIVFIILFIVFLFTIQCIYNRKIYLIEEYERLSCESLDKEIKKVGVSEENTIYLEGIKIVLGQTTLQYVYDNMINQDIDVWEDDYTNNFPHFWYNLNWTKYGYTENYGVVRIDKDTMYDVKLYFFSNQYLSPRENLDYNKCIIYGLQIPYYNELDWNLTYCGVDLKTESFESVCELFDLKEEDIFYDYFRLYIKNNAFYYINSKTQKIVRFWRNNIVDYGYMNRNFNLD